MDYFSFQSNFTNTEYDINVYVPEVEAPENGFPIIYVLDGSSYYYFVRDTVRLQHGNSIKTGVKPAIVVGIGHRKEEMRRKRFIDFTAQAEQLVVAEHAKGKIPEEYGGAELFLSFIEKELKPLIEQQFTINLKEQSLLGHSLGGYFTLWCQFNHSSLFQNYLAISPSVWWNGKELVAMCKEFIVKEKHPNVLTFIAVGEQEGFMVENAREVVEILQTQNRKVECYVAPAENHASVVPTVMSRALRFALTNEYK
ncbi:alpha/beta hydrolase [Bacillus sp. AK128]